MHNFWYITIYPQYVCVDEFDNKSKPDSEDISILGTNGIVESND